ncbi:MAG: hypothetical protein H7A40_07415 [Chlamydiales bacterium]|nr:hypothetical protein [Chlamydiales bacterium]
MTVSSSGRVGDTTYSCQVDIEKLESIFGYSPKVVTSDRVGDMTFDQGKMIVTTGIFFEIIGKNSYNICPSHFSKQVGSSEIKGDGSFEGLWDETGEKLANHFFANHKEGSIIYLNGERCRLLKKETSIELAKT